ncbi:hypothetical protein Np200711_044 [Cyanophage S-RIM44]|uniref:Uncharacterized protein n=1 Tax=Cyanophage S-RIM44 TaxID=1278485 RepID=A0A1D7SG87_9CAUD|nr:hypothetical protein HOQ83_gp222 [Cyanophage S-RIM44]AOO11525.1 hypothetical protein ES420910_044 [Cyanophage S-RIM44]AOO11990.1 hypothetical protein Np200711_044 [Cyanophage S-RIM44]AOO12226.1 hypothetical protein Np420711_044 [Cyanophage S-RIM44]AOO12691.1 hypothetical protein Sn130910_044 [Cyanophage S-RIM44]
MFAAELDVSKVYRLSDKSLLHNHAVMWPQCTSLVDSQYPEIFTNAQIDKLQKVLGFTFIDPDYFVPKSTTKFIEIYYNEEIEQIEATTDMSVEYLMDRKEWYQLSLELDPIEGIRERMLNLFERIGPNQIRIGKFKFDADGNTIGMSHTPHRITKLLQNSTLYSFIERISHQQHQVWFEHNKLNRNIVVHLRRDYTNRVYAFPANAAEKQISSLQWNKKKRPKSEVREKWIDLIEQVYGLISADDAAWIRTLIDHTDQEIDFSFVFSDTGALEDVLVYKREAKNFKSFRP